MKASRCAASASKPLALLLALAAAPASAQSLAALYQSARSYDAVFQGARAQYDASVARAAQARAGVLPVINLTAGASFTEQDVSAGNATFTRGVSARNVGVNLIQPLYRPANWATYEQGKRQEEMARAQLTLAEQDLIVRVSQAYFDVLASQDSLALVRAQKIGVAEQFAFAKRNFEVGTSTITDAREAQARYDLVIAQEIAAENDLQVKKLVLDQLVGQLGSVPTPLAAPVVLPVLTPGDVHAWLAQAEAAHPAIVQAALAVEVATLEIRKAEAGHKPTIDAQLGYNVSTNPQGNSPTASADKVRVAGASIGVVLNMPLFAGFATENRVRETLALEDQSRASLENTRRSVSVSTRAAYLGLVSGASQVKALEAAEASSQVALDANRMGYRVGVRINIDVLNSQSQLYQTKRDLALARYNVLLGDLRLRQANGTLTADALAVLNATLALDGRPAVDSAAPVARPR
ncbi:outer membrane protein [Variovorax paradoxus]|jgi:outer membrane protein|uniref:TolC family outer membrane protein n=1 Tax=Variovorax paradoxus TaxID=34073 RepID=UPI00339A4BA7